MPKINLKTGEVGCRKPGCARRMEATARHHRRCETMFIRGFGKDTKKAKTKQYKGLVQRYASFDPRDVVVLCAHHHCEIHLIYDPIIAKRRIRLYKILGEFTWDEAHNLMRTLRRLCYDWEKEETPGRNPEDCVPTRRFPDFKRGRDKKKRRKRKRGRK